MVSAESFNALSKEDRSIVRKLAIEAAELQHLLWAQRYAVSRIKAEESGMMLNEVGAINDFQERMKPIYEKFFEANPEQASIVKDILSFPGF